MTEIELRLSPTEAQDNDMIRRAAAQKLGINPLTISDLQILRRSIDARGRDAVFQLRVAVLIEGATFSPEPALLKNFKDVSDAPRVLIVGAGPAGYFAALELIELGLKPIVFDRGKDVRTRRRDLRDIQQFGIVNPHSNYCFGEGGAGTYSDGKLYTRSHKRGSIEKSLKLLVEHGAMSDILIDAHPHIGSNKLPQVVQNIRETITHFGGEVHFDSYVTDFILHQGRIRPPQVQAARRHLEIIGQHKAAAFLRQINHRRGLDGFRDHLEANPTPRIARHRDSQQTVFQKLLHRRRVQHRDQRRDKGVVRLVRDRRGFAGVIIARNRQNAAMRGGPGGIGVFQRVARPIHSRPFAIPDAQHAVLGRPRRKPDLLAAPDRCGGQIFVQARLKSDPQRVKVGLRLDQLLIIRPQRRSAIPRDERRRIQPRRPVPPHLRHRQPHQSLRPGQKHPAG